MLFIYRVINTHDVQILRENYNKYIKIISIDRRLLQYYSIINNLLSPIKRTNCPSASFFIN